MRVLHTADWHLGKILKGRDRTPEIAGALRRLLDLVRAERLELVLVAGDLFDRALVSTEAEAAAFEFFLGLRELGVPALVIAGNHDSRERMEALSPLLYLTGATVFGDVRFAEQGGVLDIPGGRAALLPFLSERRLVKANHLLEGDGSLWKGIYGEGMKKIFGNLTEAFGSDVNLLVAHLTVEGSRLGGGEFTFYTTNSYAVPPGVFPLSTSYVALGHIHRQQQVGDSPVAWYSGSLVQLDFGEGENADRGALIVEMEPGIPPRVHQVKERWGKPLKTFKMLLENLDTRWNEVASFPGLAKLVLEGRGNPALRERLFKGMPNLLEVEFNAPDSDLPTPTLPAPENWDWSEAYAEYRLEATGAGPTAELLQAFRQTYEETHAEDAKR